LTADTFDADEFAFLSLSHSFASGAVPYRDFVFPHPPGILVILRVIQPLITLWWPVARILMLMADSLTALLTWRIALALYGRRGALAAGLLYGASPVALVSGVRVGQDSLMTTLGIAGLALLVTSASASRSSTPSWASSAAAGVCLGLAIWMKYPALLFLPIYALATRNRARAAAMAISTLLVSIVLFAPFIASTHEFFQQTILWQRDRPPLDLSLRLARLAALWLLPGVLAIAALFVRRYPAWLVMGFGMGAAFMLAPQLYYHYFVPTGPFAALLAAPLLVSHSRRVTTGLVSIGAVSTLAWALTVNFGNFTVRQYVSAAHFSRIRPVVQLLDQVTAPMSYVLTDRFEYAFLARRVDAGNYFWDLQGLVSSVSLENRLPQVRAVVASKEYGQTYPQGFLDYLARHGYRKLSVGPTDVWLPAEGKDQMCCLR
jgi:hypothetical protein